MFPFVMGKQIYAEFRMRCLVTVMIMMTTIMNLDSHYNLALSVDDLWSTTAFCIRLSFVWKILEMIQRMKIIFLFVFCCCCCFCFHQRALVIMRTYSLHSHRQIECFSFFVCGIGKKHIFTNFTDFFIWSKVSYLLVVGVWFI